MKLMLVEVARGSGGCGWSAGVCRARPTIVIDRAFGVLARNSERRPIALTFDDGPSESTPALLDILDRFGARATFFQCGANVRRLPDISRAVPESGHEIGNHTDSHPLFPFRSPQFILNEIGAAQESIQQASGARPGCSGRRTACAGSACARRSGNSASLASCGPSSASTGNCRKMKSRSA